MEVYPVPNIEAKIKVEKFVMEFISHFGVPIQIKSDRGKKFDCELFQHMCDLLDVEHKMSTPFHPQGNSRVVRMSGTRICLCLSRILSRPAHPNSCKQ